MTTRSPLLPEKGEDLERAEDVIEGILHEQVMTLSASLTTSFRHLS
jgi:hypothetical protein